MTSRRTGRALSAALTLTLASAVALGFAPAASAAPVISVPVAGQYTEQAAPTAIASGVTISGGVTYAGQHMQFGITGSSPSESLSLLQDATPVTTDGVVSVVGGTVYRGNGTSADPIGTIDSVEDGAQGRTLRVNFTSKVDNAGFEQGLGDWTVYEQRVDLGVTELAGFTTQDTSTYPGNVSNQDNNPTMDDWGAPTYSVQATTDGEPTEGTYAMELSSSGMTTAAPCDVVHGPAVASGAFEAAAGDTLYFDWRAFAGADAAHVFGYLLDENGTQIEVIDAVTGYSASTPWATSETVLPRSGTFRFVFVGGTYDATCGQAAGARLLIDNIKVFGTRASDDVVQQIARKLAYANSSDTPATSRTVEVSVSSVANGTGTATIPVAVTPVDDGPAFTGAAPEARFTNNEPDDTFADVTGTLAATDPEGDAITFGLPGGTARTATIGGQTYTHAQQTALGTVHLDAASGRWVVVPDDAALEARTESGSLTVPVSATSNGLSTQRDLTVAVDVPPSAPGAPTGLTAAGRDGAVDLSWTAPTWSGGTPAQGHHVEVSADGGTTWTTASATASSATSWTVTGLTNGSPYLFRVSATNATGTGPASATTTGTPFTVPGAPALTGVVAGNRTLVLEVGAPAFDGGSPVTGYRASVDGGTTWTTPAALVDGTLTVHGLDNGRTYPVVVQAVNAAGPGASSSALPGSPVRQAVPADVVGAPGPVTTVVDGVRTTPQVVSDGQGVGVEVAGVTVRLTGVDASGKPLAGDQGTVRLEQGGWVRVRGTGFEPGSTVDVWVLGTGQSLGELTVDADGSIDGLLPLTGLLPGTITLQANGLAADGSTVRTSLRAVLAAPSPVQTVVQAAPGVAVARALPAAMASALPRTGGGVAGVLSTGVALVVAGGLLVARRRGEASVQG